MKKLRLLLFSPLALLLTSCNIDMKTSDFTSKLIPNWVSFVTQLAALIVLIIVVIIFAYKPVKKIITKRQDYIENNIKDSEISKAKWKENEIKSEETVLLSKKEAVNIVSEAKQQAILEKAAIIESANQEIVKMKEDAKKDIARMEKQAEEDIRKEIVSVALDASKEILGREVSEKDNARLVDEFIEEVKK